jgi:hypothetical protein
MSDLRDRYREESVTDQLLVVGEAANFTKRLALDDGDELVWSPFCAYEQPEALVPLFTSFDEPAVRAAFERVRAYQGLPVEGDAAVLGEAVGSGVLLANAIKGSGGEASFAFLPYRATPEQRRIQKIILEKALILLSCVRYGQHYAKHPIRMPGAILRALLEGRLLHATTEAPSQYRTAAQAQIVRLEPSRGAGWFRPRLIETADNVAAARLALDLLEHGEPVSQREDPDQKLLFTGGRYLTPLMTMKEHRSQARLDGDVVLSLIDTFRGERGG